MGELIPDLADIKWPGRDMAIAYDSDIADKPRVQAAERRLSDELTMRGALVRAVRLPAGDNGEKVGLDDYLISHSVDDFIETVSNTQPTASSYELPVSLEDLMSREYPPTEYVLADFILKGEVNLLFGDGGVGKSLLSLYVALAVAAGKPLFEKQTIQMPVIGLFAEDGSAQMQQRIRIIGSSLGMNAKGGIPIKFWCRPPEDTTLAVIDDSGVVHELPRLHALRAELSKIGRPAFVILDSLADLFSINESLRLPVNAALKKVLGGLCRDFGATVLVLAHPSKASMADGSHYSGSTAFNNGVRQRLTLEVEKQSSGDFADGPPPRLFRVAKSNYGQPAEMTLWFYDASIEAAPRRPVASLVEERQAVLNAVLSLIDKGIRVIKSNGDGQKPTDIADAIWEKNGFVVSVKRVRQCLASLEREGLLAYRQSDKNARPYVPSQYIRGPQCKR